MPGFRRVDPEKVLIGRVERVNFSTRLGINRAIGALQDVESLQKFLVSLVTELDRLMANNAEVERRVLQLEESSKSNTGGRLLGYSGGFSRNLSLGRTTTPGSPGITRTSARSMFLANIPDSYVGQGDDAVAQEYLRAGVFR